jgi:cardiolipin synthase
MRQLPNALTLLRILLIPFVLWLVATHRHGVALGVLALSGATDVADGWLARRLDARTRLGEIADPIADKATTMSVSIVLAAQHLLPAWAAAAIVARDVVIVGGAVVFHLRRGRFAMEPSLLSKLNTGIVYLLLATVLADAGGLIDAAPVRAALLAAALVTVVGSGVQYVWVWGRRARSRTGG